MKKDKKKIIYILVFFSFVLFLFSIKYIFVKKRNFDINIEGIDKLMIVAHPDDEMLWGGGSLIKEDYLVVCITCGNNIVRNYEFINVMNKTNDKYILLGYPDKEKKSMRSKWKRQYKNIEEDLKTIINLKNWKLIVTHNPDGEYGHIHHKMTSKMVTSEVDDKNKLYYFGNFYKKRDIKNIIDELIPLEGNILKEKEEMLGIYQSQSFYQFRYQHMIPFENWIRYDEWSKDEKLK